MKKNPYKDISTYIKMVNNSMKKTNWNYDACLLPFLSLPKPQQINPDSGSRKISYHAENSTRIPQK